MLWQRSRPACGPTFAFFARRMGGVQFSLAGSNAGEDVSTSLGMRVIDARSGPVRDAHYSSQVTPTGSLDGQVPLTMV